MNIKKVLLFASMAIILMVIAFVIYRKVLIETAIPVLAYHGVTKNVMQDIDIEIEKFRKQMKWLSDNDYETLTMDELYDWKNGNLAIKGKKVVITFDDGKEDFYTTAMPILEEYDLKATVFVIGSRKNLKGFLSEEQINDIKQNHKNINIESHSYRLHDADEVGKIEDYVICDEDIKKNDEYEYYAYPFGRENENYIKALKDNKYKMAFKFSPSKWTSKDSDNFRMPRVLFIKVHLI